MKTKIAGIVLALARRILMPRPCVDVRVEHIIVLNGDIHINIQQNDNVVAEGNNNINKN